MSQEALHCFHTDLNVFILGGGGLFEGVLALLKFNPDFFSLSLPDLVWWLMMAAPSGGGAVTLSLGAQLTLIVRVNVHMVKLLPHPPPTCRSRVEQRGRCAAATDD